jgi:hypothetical protein
VRWTTHISNPHCPSCKIIQDTCLYSRTTAPPEQQNISKQFLSLGFLACLLVFIDTGLYHSSKCVHLCTCILRRCSISSRSFWRCELKSSAMLATRFLAVTSGLPLVETGEVERRRSFSKARRKPVETPPPPPPPAAVVDCGLTTDPGPVV